MYIISEAVFEGNEKAAELAGYMPLSIVINDVFKCHPTVLPDCCDVSKFFIKKSYLLYARKKPKHSFVAFDKILLDIYNCCENKTLCPPSSSGVNRYWIQSSMLRPKATIETIDLKKFVLKAFKCCDVTTCGC
jgi:hypothetical protein